MPEQPWLDGYCVEKGIIRQFVAMPLGEGYSVEEQLTGEAEFGGIQIEVFPMRSEVFERRFPVFQRRRIQPATVLRMLPMCLMADSAGMGLAPGGRMRQEIYEDPFSIHDWDTEHGSRCFVHLVNSATWKAITGQARPPILPRPGNTPRQAIRGSTITMPKKRRCEVQPSCRPQKRGGKSRGEARRAPAG